MALTANIHVPAGCGPFHPLLDSSSPDFSWNLFQSTYSHPCLCKSGLFEPSRFCPNKSHTVPLTHIALLGSSMVSPQTSLRWSLVDPLAISSEVVSVASASPLHHVVVSSSPVQMSPPFTPWRAPSRRALLWKDSSSLRALRASPSGADRPWVTVFYPIFLPPLSCLHGSSCCQS